MGGLPTPTPLLPQAAYMPAPAAPARRLPPVALDCASDSAPSELPPCGSGFGQALLSLLHSLNELGACLGKAEVESHRIRKQLGAQGLFI